MIKYQIKSKNLNNSLVFYRALFDEMPDQLGLNRIRFSTGQFALEVTEGEKEFMDEFIMEIKEENELKDISRRMRRFRSMERFKQNCATVEGAIGLIDPDGYKWKIGNPSLDVEYEKCYVTL